MYRRVNISLIYFFFIDKIFTFIIVLDTKSRLIFRLSFVSFVRQFLKKKTFSYYYLRLKKNRGTIFREYNDYFERHTSAYVRRFIKGNNHDKFQISKSTLHNFVLFCTVYVIVY